MVQDSLSEATFEPIDVASTGDLIFINTLVKLRRSFAGMHNKIFPVYVLNPYVKNKVLASAGASATGNTTIYTTSATKRTFVTGFLFSHSASATCDDVGGFINYSCVENPSINSSVGITKMPLTASDKSVFIPFNEASEITKNTPIFISQNITVGTATSYLVIFGYEKD